MLEISNVSKLHYSDKKQRLGKDLSSFFRKRLQVRQKMVGILKKWKSLEIFLHSKLSNLILHLKLGIEIIGDSWFFNYINKQLLKINSDLKLITT
jgi:hypothetical protein